TLVSAAKAQADEAQLPTTTRFRCQETPPSEMSTRKRGKSCVLVRAEGRFLDRDEESRGSVTIPSHSTRAVPIQQETTSSALPNTSPRPARARAQVPRSSSTPRSVQS